MFIASSTIRDWLITEDNAGSAVIESDDMVRITTASAANTDRCFLYKRLDAYAGDTFRVSFSAKCISGTFAASFNYPNSTTIVKESVQNSGNFENYSLEYTVPVDSNNSSDYLHFAIGQYTGHSGEVLIKDLRIEVLQSRLPTVQCYANCLLRINNTSAGSIDVHPSFSDIGVDKTDLATKTVSSFVDIKIPKTIGLAESKRAPVFHVTMSEDNSTGEVLPKIGSYNLSLGTVRIRFFNTTSGAPIDISTKGACFVWFSALG